MTTQQTDIEKTLKRILARELKEWPEGYEALTQSCSGCEIINDDDFGASLPVPFFASKRHSEFEIYPQVTRADWEAERALLASEQAQPLGNSEEFDQALWDRVAIAAAQAFITAHITHHGHGDNIWPKESLMECAADYAGAFMAERAKRIAARKASHD